MVAPKKSIMGRGESAVSVGARTSSSRIKVSRKPVIKVQPEPNAKAKIKSNVKVKFSTTSKNQKSFNSKTTTALKNQSSGKSTKAMSKLIKNYNKKNPGLKLPTKIINSGM